MFLWFCWCVCCPAGTFSCCVSALNVPEIARQQSSPVLWFIANCCWKRAQIFNFPWKYSTLEITDGSSASYSLLKHSLICVCVIRRRYISLYSYADDTQLYVAVSSDAFWRPIDAIFRCFIICICAWMLQNLYLQVNQDRNEILAIICRLWQFCFCFHYWLQWYIVSRVESFHLFSDLYTRLILHFLVLLILCHFKLFFRLVPGRLAPN